MSFRLNSSSFEHHRLITSDFQANHKKLPPPPEYLQIAESLFVPVSLPALLPVRIRKCGEAYGENGGIRLRPITGFEKTGVGGPPAVAPFGKVKPDATVPLLVSRYPV